MERLQPKKPKVENPGVLAIVTPGLAAKEILMEAAPEMYETDSHYANFPAVLVRLEAVGREELEDLLIQGWRSKAPNDLIARFEAQDTYS